MKTTLLSVFLVLIAAGCEKQNEVIQEYDFKIVTPDSVFVFGDEYLTQSASPTIILFHQGGANARSEYASIIPRLTQQGFNIVAVDQRRGGQTFGNYNRTVAQLGLKSYSYCDAYDDLETTLDYVDSSDKMNGKIIVWGSSYSAALAIQLASKNPDRVSAVLAFSPASGDPMAGCTPEEYFDKMKEPLLLLRPSGEMEIESIQAQFKLAQDFGHDTYVAKNGRHGSSMLVEERVGADVGENWTTVLDFISAALDAN